MSAGFCSVSTGCRGFRKALANGFLNVPFEGPRKGNITLFVLIRSYINNLRPSCCGFANEIIEGSEHCWVASL